MYQSKAGRGQACALSISQLHGRKGLRRRTRKRCTHWPVNRKNQKEKLKEGKIERQEGDVEDNHMGVASADTSVAAALKCHLHFFITSAFLYLAFIRAPSARIPDLEGFRFEEGQHVDE